MVTYLAVNLEEVRVVVIFIIVIGHFRMTRRRFLVYQCAAVVYCNWNQYGFFCLAASRIM